MLRLIHHWNRITCRFEDQWVTDVAARGMRHIGKAALAGMITCTAAVIPPTSTQAGPVVTPPGHTDRGTPSIDQPGIPPIYGVRDVDDSPFKFQVFQPGPLPAPEHHGHKGPPDYRHPTQDVPEPWSLPLFLGAIAALAGVLLARSAPVEPNVRVTVLSMTE